MKILMLTAEYPPQNVGGLSNHVYNLCKDLSLKGHEVHVITIDNGSACEKEMDGNVYIHRVVPLYMDTEDLIKQVIHGNFSMVEEGIRLMKEFGEFHIIHAHDWSTSFAAKTLKLGFKIPLVSTIHSTEYGRNSGIRTDMQKYISKCEWILNYESWKVIVCSDYMKKQLNEVFNCPEDKITIIPNGINLIDVEFNKLEFKRKYCGDNEKIVFFVGRHVYEKGIQILIKAIPEILRYFSNTKFIIAGTGPLTLELKERVKSLGVDEFVSFVGYIDDETKNKFYKIADVAIFPSIYEPFGIVALEAMSLGCPVVVSNTGGLDEIVEHEVDGMKILSESESSVCFNLLRILKEKDLKEKISKNGKIKAVEVFSWKSVADKTIELYNEVRNEALKVNW